MSASLSVEEVLANLEAQIEFHRQQELHHAEKEAFHREQRAAHATELEGVLRHYEAFRGVAGSAVEAASRKTIPPPLPPEPVSPPFSRPVRPSRLVTRVATERPAGQPFTATELAAEINHRFRNFLKSPVNPRLAAAALRRLVDNGILRVAQAGTPHHEATYAKV